MTGLIYYFVYTSEATFRSNKEKDKNQLSIIIKYIYKENI